MRRALLCLLLLAAPGWAAEPCPCKCPCAKGELCTCGAGCKCPACPELYADGYEKVKKGAVLKLAVGVKAKAGEFQSPPLPNVKPGVYRWYAKDGVPTCDFILVPTPTERNERYKQGDGVPQFQGPFFPPPNSPFTLPGCLPGKA